MGPEIRLFVLDTHLPPYVVSMGINGPEGQVHDLRYLLRGSALPYEVCHLDLGGRQALIRRGQ